jgi:hypothetical protein
MPQDGYIAVSAAYPNAVHMAKAAPCRAQTYAARDASPAADFRPSCLHFSPKGSAFEVQKGGLPLGTFSLPLSGFQNVENALGIVACGQSLGLSVEALQAGLQSFQGVLRRQETKVLSIATRKGGAREIGTREIGTRETGTREIGARETGAREIGTREIGTREIGAREIGTRETGTREIGTREIGARETGAREIGTREIGTREIGAREIGAREIGAREIGAREIGAREIGTRETGTREIGAREIGAREIGARETDSREGGTREIGTREIGTREGDTAEGSIVLVDDFAHHPTAVRETVQGVWQRYGGRRLWALFEPRSNTSRRKLHQKDYAGAFAEAAVVRIRRPLPHDKIPPGEALDVEQLAADLRALGKDAAVVDKVDDLVEELVFLAQPGDVVLCMSNGRFDGLSDKLAKRF